MCIFSRNPRPPLCCAMSCSWSPGCLCLCRASPVLVLGPTLGVRFCDHLTSMLPACKESPALLQTLQGGSGSVFKEVLLTKLFFQPAQVPSNKPRTRELLRLQRAVLASGILLLLTEMSVCLKQQLWSSGAGVCAWQVSGAGWDCSGGTGFYQFAICFIRKGASFLL